MKKAGKGPERAAIIYARVSSTEQEREGYSIPAQLELLRGYARRLGLDILREFVDVETAKQEGRAAFAEMLGALKKTGCKVILVEKTDRLYRNFYDWVAIDRLAVEIHMVKEGAVISQESRSSEKFVHGIKVLMAKQYVDNLAEEASKGMREKARQGIWPSAAPLGYRNVIGRDGRRVIEPDPETAPLIEQLFRLYATGNYSLSDSVRVVRQLGLQFRRSKASVPKSSIHRILRNPLYKGEILWRGEVYPGQHQPLVSAETFDQVSQVLDGHFGHREKRHDHRFLFTGLINCGHCSGSLVGRLHKARLTYYHCAKPKRVCPEPYAREETLSQWVATWLDRLAIPQAILPRLQAELLASKTGERQAREAAVERLERQLGVLARRLEAMYEDKLDGRIDASFYDRKAGEVRAEQERLRRDIERHSEASDYLPEGARLLELAGRAGELYRVAPAEEQRRLLQFLLLNAVWKDSALVVQLRRPFDLLLVAQQGAQNESASGVSQEADFANWRGRRDLNPRPPA